MINFTGIKTIFWDFDGVILDSMSIRDRGFEMVLSDFPSSEVEQLLTYHRANGGLSRYVKFRYFFEKIRGEQTSEEKIQDYAARFSEIMLSELGNRSLLIQDSVDFISKSDKDMYIVSGSDQKELRKLCELHKIDQYFLGIYGSPTPKKQLVANLIKSSDIDLSRAALIGDSINDYEAATENNVAFFGYNNPTLKSFGKDYIEGFKQLKCNE